MARLVLLLLPTLGDSTCFDPQNCCATFAKRITPTPDVCKKRGCSYNEASSVCFYKGKECSKCTFQALGQPCSGDGSDICSSCVGSHERTGIFSWGDVCRLNQAQLDAKTGVEHSCASTSCCIQSAEVDEPTPDRCNAEGNCKWSSGDGHLSTGCYYNGPMCFQCAATTSAAQSNQPCEAKVNATEAETEYCQQQCRYQKKLYGPINCLYRGAVKTEEGPINV